MTLAVLCLAIGAGLVWGWPAFFLVFGGFWLLFYAVGFAALALAAAVASRKAKA